MKIPCTCGYDRSVCVDCMQDHIDSLHDNLRRLVDKMEKVKNGITDPLNDAYAEGFFDATNVWQSELSRLSRKTGGE